MPEGKGGACAERGCSVAGIALERGLFLVGKRAGAGKQGGRWEFLGGKAEGGEAPREALEREFREETGFAVSAGELICRAEFENNGRPVDLCAFSVALPAGFSIEGAACPDHTRLAWLSLEEIASLDLVDSDRRLLPGIEKWLALEGKQRLK